jgi:hypothetical protein
VRILRIITEVDMTRMVTFHCHFIRSHAFPHWFAIASAIP